ncbi:MAG: rhodanese-like domain-containing protein [Clostridia bacterium]|nr:rhodanese-like domain-containing protein [Clostridia bacterium]
MLFEKKKLLALLLALVLVFSLAACGGGAEEPAEEPAGAEEPAEEPVEEVDVVEEAALAFFDELPGLIVPAEDVIAKINEGEELFLLDIRKAEDYAAGHLVDSINAPWGTSSLVDNLDSIPMDETVYVYCYTGQTAGQTVGLMKIAGFDSKSIKYGFKLGISKVEGYEALITTDVKEFDEPQGSELDPELKAMIADYFSNMNATYGSNIIPAEKLKEALDAEDDSYFLVSIRQADAYAEGHIPGAINIPFQPGMQESFGDLPKDKTIVIYCYSGQTAGQTVGGLRVLGYDAISLKSGMGTPVTDPSGWANEGFEVVQ